MIPNAQRNWMIFWLKWGGRMKKLGTLVMHNLKKDKGSYISFGIIILFTAFMMNLALVLAFQVDKAYDSKFESLNAANINFCIPNGSETEKLEDDIMEMEEISDLENRNGIFTTAVIQAFRGTDFSMNTVFYNMDESRKCNKLEMKEESKETFENPIYVPLYVASFGQFEVGEEIIYEIEGKEYTFQIAGVVEEMQYGNYGMGLMGAYLPDEVYQKFSEEMEQNQVVEYSLMTGKKADIETATDKVNSLLKKHGITKVSNCNSDMAKQTRTMVCNLMILILLAFACVILLVSIFLCKFRIQNSIEEEMINMGVLKALGYTSSMIIGTMVLPYLIVGVFAIVVGAAVSYVVLPALSKVLALQSGFSFQLSFDACALILIVLILLSVIFFFTYWAAKRIKKIQPINAIRGNGEGKCVKKNHFPLDKTTGNPQFILILKQITASAKQNVLLFLVSFVLMILVAFAGTLFYNVIIEPDHFMKTLSEEMPQIIFQPETGKEAKLKDILKKDSRVDNVLEYMTETVGLQDSGITAFVCEDFSKVSNDLCYMGRNPQSDDEVAIGSAFADVYNLGENVEIRRGEVSRTYEVVGFVQSVNYQGEICELTVDGYEQLTEGNVVPSYYIYLPESVDTEAFLEEFEEKHSDIIKNSVNSDKMTKTSQEMFAGLATVIIAAIFVLTILIVLFILYIVMKSLITQRKQEFGIYKAMGYTNWQLIMQMAGSFLPVSSVAVLLSAVLGLIYMPMINQFIFQTVGAMKNSLEVSFVFLILFALAQIAMNFVISICLAMPIRKISAYSLIKE